MVQVKAFVSKVTVSIPYDEILAGHVPEHIVISREAIQLMSMLEDLHYFRNNIKAYADIINSIVRAELPTGMHELLFQAVQKLANCSMENEVWFLFEWSNTDDSD